MAGGIDSLTAGGGETWRKFFIEQVRGGLGDGGPGYGAFAQEIAGESGATMTLAGSVTAFKIGSAEGKLSIDGYGVSTAAADASASITWHPGSAWQQARIYFLKQPGGGKVRCYNGSQDAAAATATDTEASDYGLGYIDVGRGADVAGQSFVCSGFTGKVALFGALVTLKPGLVMASWAEGGRSLATVSTQSSPMRRAWFAEFKPKYYFLNAGTNDNGSPPAQFEVYLREFITDIQIASPATIIYMVQPNETANSHESYSNYFEFVTVRQRVAASLNIRFVDNRSVLGDYAQAVASGYMSDNTHPNGAGEKRVGVNFAEITGLKTDTPDPGFTSY